MKDKAGRRKVCITRKGIGRELQMPSSEVPSNATDDGQTYREKARAEVARPARENFRESE